LFSSVPISEKLFIGGDLNGHVGSTRAGFDEVHGGFGYGSRNQEGEGIHMHVFLLLPTSLHKLPYQENRLHSRSPTQHGYRYVYQYPADTDTAIRHFMKQYDTSIRFTIFFKKIQCRPAAQPSSTQWPNPTQQAV
jgi:hypothetical protein